MCNILEFDWFCRIARALCCVVQSSPLLVLFVGSRMNCYRLSQGRVRVLSFLFRNRSER
jgi:hypothetical protein